MIPFSKRFNRFVVRLPHRKLSFRPVFLEEFYMALGLWEPYVCQVFKPCVGQIVLDIGAHIGYYTLKSAEAVGKEGLVIAVEPDFRNFQVLKKNVASFQNVRLMNCAISDSESSGSFINTINPLYSRLNNQSSFGKVKLMTLDKLCRQFDVKPDWVKIDVEDSCFNVMSSGLKILRPPTRILIEITNKQSLHFLENQDYFIEPLSCFYGELGYYFAHG